jgi:hypothetical protein
LQLPRLLGLAVLGFAFCSKPTFGDGYTYNYTGVPFTLFQGLTCPPHCTMNGSLTASSPFPANFDGFITPLSFGFTVGSTTISSSSPDLVDYEMLMFTNSSDQIDYWVVGIGAFSGTEAIKFLAVNSPSGGGQYFQLGSNSVYSFTLGRWTGPTPEPSSLILLGSGLLALPGFGAIRGKRPLAPLRKA